MQIPRPGRQQASWRNRKIAYVDAISRKSASACLVSAADKLHNARAILRDFHTHDADLWSRFNKDAGEAGTLGYYRGLAEAFQQRAGDLREPRLRALSEELSAVVSELERQVGKSGIWPPAQKDVMKGGVEKEMALRQTPLNDD